MNKSTENQKRLYFQRYVVAGRTEFPIDMLYWDESFPTTPIDVPSIRKLGRNDQDTYIELGRYVTSKTNQPRAKGWKHYGWRVVKFSVQIS